MRTCTRKPEDRRLVLEVDVNANKAKILHVNDQNNGIIVGSVLIGGGACTSAQKTLCIELLKDMVKSANTYREANGYDASSNGPAFAKK